ncbi:hypothetical protein [Frankia sp. AvcI1]|uniref:hypothetical protein n=1 Tax=Frankia sp. AvcI1 TaxID=573496 RepID=UPI002119951A|nr:hypothetical protein [Frankia sp. AvcI1]
MGYVMCSVSVARFADVVALLGVGLEARPGLLQHLHHVPLSYPLLEPTGQHLGGGLRPDETPVQSNRFICGEEGDAGLLKDVLDLGADVGASSDPVNGLTDHGVEPSVGSRGFLKQIGHTTVARYGNLEHFVRAAMTSISQVLTPGLHVVEMRDDHRVRRQCPLGSSQLPRQ